MGGPQVFSSVAWQSATIDGQGPAYSMPWMGYVYVICYRRDLFAKAGVDEQSAFTTSENLAKAVNRLKDAGVEYPYLLPAVPPPYNDMLHHASSWVWGAGGNFLSADNHKTLFCQPESIAGLKAYFEANRLVPPAAQNLLTDQCVELFTQGKAAIVVADIRQAMGIAAGSGGSQVAQNLGTAALSGAPWYGGSDLVVWRHTQGYPERERAAIALVNFMASYGTQLAYGQKAGALPARVDTYSELFPSGSPLSTPMQQASKAWRSYPAASLWRRIEFQLAQTLAAIRTEALANPTADLCALLHAHLDPLSRRLDMTLSQ